MRDYQPRDLSYELSLRAEDVARRLLGESNRKQSSKRELRYGNHGSFRVVIAGRRAGQWNDFERGERGDLLDLIRREQHCSFGEACDWARNRLGIRQDDAKPARPQPAPKPKPEPEDDSDRSRYPLRILMRASRSSARRTRFILSRGVSILPPYLTCTVSCAGIRAAPGAARRVRVLSPCGPTSSAERRGRFNAARSAPLARRSTTGRRSARAGTAASACGPMSMLSKGWSWVRDQKPS